MELVNLPLEGIRITGGTQPRVETNEATIAEYAEFIRFGGELPPVVVFDDGAEIFLADGFHRFHAHKMAGAMEIACDVRQGTKRDAILYSVGANAAHGLRRSNGDKRKAVMTLLNDTEWSTWSDREIAKACGVAHSFVAALRRPEVAEKQQANRVASVVRKIADKVESDSTQSKVESDSTHMDTHPEAESGMAAAPAAIASAPAEKPPVPASEVDLLREQLEDLRASMKETLADNEMMGRVFDADDRIKAAMDEAKRQKAIAENAERTLAAKNGEYVERARAVTHWKNRAEKAEKALAKLQVAA